MSTFEPDIAERFGPDATAEAAYDVLTVDVPAAGWPDALRTARDELGCTYFDWLSAVDEPGTGFRVCAHVVALPKAGAGAEERAVRRLLLRTTVPHEAPVLASAVEVYAGAAWHERETYEMFGISFTGHPHLVPLLLPDGFEGHPLRKDFVLAARVAKAWPGAKEPGESEHGGPKRRQMLPPGVPDPNEWGPLKGQLPPAPARPARTPRAAGERPPRRTRSVTEGSASQAPEAAEAPAAPARRARTATEGSASPRPPAAEPVAPPATTAPEGPAARPARRARSASEGSATQREARPDAASEAAAAEAAAARPRSADAPWHHARPAFDDSEPKPEPTTAVQAEPEPASAAEAQAKPEAPAKPEPAPEPEAQPEPAGQTKPEPEAQAEREPAAQAEPEPAAGPEAQPELRSEPEAHTEPAPPPAPEAPTEPGSTPTDRPAARSDEGPGDEPADSEGGDPA
ncbi:NADH-quinone oxidoreductase subunit C [Streptomyces sp. NPDC059909]|uniref:NADH-quinone oxidoreductase subunit C n=1 Tax=Streptomyces sp. NPDC059909 TaxID=3346998 RepID=UPI0036562B1B